jgi:uncharacterized protein
MKPPDQQPPTSDSTARQDMLPSDPGERTDPRLLELLVCPLTQTTLEYNEPDQELISRRANLAYPIRNGVPILTRDAARNLDDPKPSHTPSNFAHPK